MISLLVVAKDGGAVETATIGREGALGLHGALGRRLSFTRATIQIPGKFSVIRVTAFAQLALEHAPVRDLIARYMEVAWAEAQQIAACNAAHVGIDCTNGGRASDDRDPDGAIAAAPAHYQIRAGTHRNH